jgi:hypothetical protein
MDGQKPVGVGFVAIFALTTGWRSGTSVLVGWDLGVAVYLVLCFWMFSVCDMGHISPAVGIAGRRAVCNPGSHCVRGRGQLSCHSS